MSAHDPLTNARPSLCECGHPKEAHGPQEFSGRYGKTPACLATIYQNVPNGMNAWPCKCQRFKATAE